MGIGRPEVSHISILGPILPPMKRGSFCPRTSHYGICTDMGNTFLTMGIGSAAVSHISILGPILPPMKRGSFLPLTSQYGICTDEGNTFLNSPCP